MWFMPTLRSKNRAFKRTFHFLLGMLLTASATLLCIQIEYFLPAIKTTNVVSPHCHCEEGAALTWQSMESLYRQIRLYRNLSYFFKKQVKIPT